MSDAGVGTSPPRLEAGDKATGRAQYADDIRLPGMLHAALATSPHAHARIVGYRVDAARALPGVKAIVTGADLTGPRAGGIIKDESMVARGKVRYVGEIVAAVAATDPATAAKAAAAIEIDYEPLPAVLSIDEALAPGAPILHEDVRRVCQGHPGRRPRQRGVREQRRGRRCRARLRANATWWSRAPGRPRRSTTSTWSRTAAWPTSTRAGRITLHATCQSVHHVQQRVAEELGEPMAKIRVVATRVGGGFGGKHASNIHSIAAWLARAGAPPGQARALAHAGFRDAALAPSGAHLDEDRRAARRHDPRARRAHHHRRRRLRRREPAGARLCAADVARALPDRERARARPGASTRTSCAPVRSAASAIRRRASPANRRSTSSP